MSYPKREVVTDWGEVLLIEMTPEEYEEILKLYKEKTAFFLNSKYRNEQEYGQYLKRWFSEEECDGAPFSLKYKWHKLPKDYFQYTFG